MNQRQRMPACGSLVVIALIAACGGRQSVASKSAAAYEEARRNGTPVTGGQEHGGHAAASATTSGGSEMPGMDHSTMSGTAPAMSGMDHSQMQSESMPGVDHSRMQSGSMSGMDHSKMQSGTGTMSGMDHGSMPGMQHGAAPASAEIVAPVSNSEIAGIRPAARLETDMFDTPSPVAVTEAVKSANNVPDGDIRHIVPGQDSENPPTPQPAFRDGGSGSQTDHSQHGQATLARPAASQPATDHNTRGQSAPVSSQAQPAAATVFACPKHPEVTSDKPGTCPKCGMALVKRNR